MNNEIEKHKSNWNWGAALLTIPFSLYTKTYIGLLTLLSIIPIFGWIFGIFWFFYFGFNAERMSEDSDFVKNKDDFNLQMNNWNRVGLIYLFLTLIIITLYVLIIVFAFTTGQFNK